MKKVDVTLKAHKQIAKLSRQDLPEIYAALESLVHWPEISGVKALVGKPGYRLRIGAYRAFFQVSGDTVTVTEVKRRNEHTY